MTLVNFERAHKSDDRVPDWERAMGHFRQLKEICHRFDLARDELNVRVEQDRVIEAKAIADQRRFVLTIAITLLGIVVSAVVGMLAIPADRLPWYKAKAPPQLESSKPR